MSVSLTRHYVADYRRLVRQLFATLPADEALSAAVGGNFAGMGEVEKRLLIHYGLSPGHTLIDVGCGSGRLAARLCGFLADGHYLGIDVVPELVEHARRNAPPGWEFLVIDDLAQLDPPAEMADFACFFSVFTHLLPEESYAYLELAKRALRPGGRIVFSFLEYDRHWRIFAESVEAAWRGQALPHLNTFLGRDTLALWCGQLGLHVVDIRGGDEAVIPLDEDVSFDDGSSMSGIASLGQSFAVLEKR